MVEKLIKRIKSLNLKEILGLKPIPYIQKDCEHFDFDRFRSPLEPLSSPAFYPTLIVECPVCKKRGRLTCHKDIVRHTMKEKKLVWTTK